LKPKPSKILLKKQKQMAEMSNLLRRKSEKCHTVIKNEMIDAPMEVQIKVEEEAMWQPLVEDHSVSDEETLLLDEDDKAVKPKSVKQSVIKEIPKRPRGTKCLVCGFEPDSIESSIKHFQDILDDPTFQITTKKDKQLCPVCEKNGNSVEKYRMTHMRVHMEEAHHKTTKCEQCSLELPTVKDHLMHQRTHALEQKRQNRRKNRNDLKQCPICEKTYKRMSFDYHYNDCNRKAKNEYLVCEVCSYKTFYYATFNFHKKRKHTEDGGLKWACEFCPKKFFDLHRRNAHQTLHSEEKNSICDICSERFSSDTYLRKHLIRHAKQFRFECKKCLQKFKDKKGTIRHILIHSDVPCYKCVMCDKTFMNRPAGSTHNKECHDNKAQIKTINPDHINDLFKTCVREIQETDEGNTRFKRMRGSNVGVAAKLAELVKEDMDQN